MRQKGIKEYYKVTKGNVPVSPIEIKVNSEKEDRGHTNPEDALPNSPKEKVGPQVVEAENEKNIEIMYKGLMAGEEARNKACFLRLGKALEAIRVAERLESVFEDTGKKQLGIEENVEEAMTLYHMFKQRCF